MNILKKKNKKYIFPILMGIFMSLAMSIINTGGVKFPEILLTMLIQSSCALIASIIFPAGMHGAKIAKKYVKDENSILFLLLSSILPAIYFTLIQSFIGMARMLGFSENFLRIYLNALPMNILIGYSVSLILNLILDRILK